MSKPIERVEVITGIHHRRRRYTAEEKVRLVKQTMQPGITVSAVAGSTASRPACCSRGGGAWPRAGKEVVRTDEEVVPVSRVRERENRIRELERLLGRKTMETEILREAIEQARPKKHAWRLPSPPPADSR